jgi:hypothetical protein
MELYYKSFCFAKTKALQLPYFSSQPGPTPYHELPLPQSILDKIKAKSDALANQSKRKLPDESSGEMTFHTNLK